MENLNTVLILGSTGATGKPLLRMLLDRGFRVRTVVRSVERLPADLRNHPRLEVDEGVLPEMDEESFKKLMNGVQTVASCLGHNPTIRGIFGKPRRLVTDAVRRSCEALTAAGLPARFLLMNTIANRNRDLDEPLHWKNRIVTVLLRVLLPPHPDNEQAADYLRTQIGQNHQVISWVAVRPDALIDEEEVSEYELHASPVRNPIFQPGKISRVNVAHFMADLISDDSLWQRWKGQMPVITSPES